MNGGEQQFDLAISALYESVLDLDQIGCFLKQASSYLGARAAHFHLFDFEAAQLQHSVSSLGMSPDEERRYVREYAPIDPRLKAHAAVAPGVWFRDHTVFDEAFVRRDEVYQALMQHDIRYSAGIRFGGRGRSATLGFLRAARQRPFEGEVERRLDRLTPHMKRAFRIQSRLDALHVSSTLATTMLDRSNAAVVIADEAARIVFLTAAAERALRGTTGLTSSRGFLTAPDPLVSTRLGQALANATRNSHGRCATTAFPIVSGSSRAMQVVVLPLRADTLLAGLWQRPLALVALLFRDRDAAIAPELLMQTFGLTAREAAVAIAVASGHSLRDWAGAQAVSIHTVRSQLKSAMAKLGVRRQAELASLVEGLQLAGDPADLA